MESLRERKEETKERWKRERKLFIWNSNLIHFTNNQCEAHGRKEEKHLCVDVCASYFLFWPQEKSIYIKRNVLYFPFHWAINNIISRFYSQATLCQYWECKFCGAFNRSVNLISAKKWLTEWGCYDYLNVRPCGFSKWTWNEITKGKM